MSKGLIIAIVVIVIVAAAGYMFLYNPGSIPSYTSQPTAGSAETGASQATVINESAANSAATQAETIASDTAGQIAAADNLTVPDVK